MRPSVRGTTAPAAHHPNAKDPPEYGRIRPHPRGYSCKKHRMRMLASCSGGHRSSSAWALQLARHAGSSTAHGWLPQAAGWPNFYTSSIPHQVLRPTNPHASVEPKQRAHVLGSETFHASMTRYATDRRCAARGLTNGGWEESLPAGRR